MLLKRIKTNQQTYNDSETLRRYAGSGRDEVKTSRVIGQT